METKKWWQSRTLWVNVLAGIAMVIQALTGKEWLDTEAQVGILAIINLILRLRTDQGLRR